jgi:glycosyltransferase involved in cell wall biosynthesis
VSGTVAVASQALARFHAFTQCYRRLETPADWAHASHHCYDTAYGRNRLVKLAVGDHILFLDDDVTFPPDLLARLLKHRVPVVGGLYLKKTHPFTPAPDIKLEGPPGLRKTNLVATGALLVEREVFNELEYPYFLSGYNDDGDPVGDDGYFCQQLTKAGVPIYCDTSCWIGHMGTVAIRPAYKKGKWVVTLGIAGGTAGDATDLELDAV